MVDRFAFSEATVWKINPFGNWVRIADYEAIEKKANDASAQLEACRSLNASLRVDIEALRARLETVEAETRERCAKVAHDAADEYEVLILRGQGKRGSPGYIDDSVWYSWTGKHSALSDLADDIRNLGPRP